MNARKITSTTPHRPHGPVGRFAPSPSGRMHLGNIYSALMAWLSVRSQRGTLILRIEDLDDRCRRGLWDEQLIEDLEWLGLTWDVGPIYQSDRRHIYHAVVNHLNERGLLYPCFCSRAELHTASAPHASDGTPVYAGTCRNLSPKERRERAAMRPGALRLRVPDANDPAGTYRFTDRVWGSRSECLATECGDFLIQRSDGVIAYQLAVTVDDALMGVTEVVRGHDLLGSVARQMYIQDLLGFTHPAYAHVPMLVAPDGRRLSKREKDCDMGELRSRFESPEKLIGWLAHATGLAPTDAPCSAADLVDFFSWERFSRSPADIVVPLAP
ncbi:MAG: tRNA glutamyl-Q(34) synthetase GluQRS [Coriobacteriaceae bacterium]|nr:tRNA glutamyl-Q(34) synthetase GluQRS [Coriobacteriaceae bacterium]